MHNIKRPDGCTFRRMISWKALTVLTAVVLLSSCQKDEADDGVDPSITGPSLILKYKFDSTQVRLDNLGQPSTLPLGHAGQSPVFNAMSAHYVEFTPDAFTALGAGEVVYQAAETNAGGQQAIDFDQAVLAGDGEVFLQVPLSELSPGTYNWLRVSLAYQNFDIAMRISSPVVMDVPGTLAGFIGYNTYITSFDIEDSTMVVNDDKLQGFWAMETEYLVISGQAAPGAITVPNPIFANSPIPAGSCVVTGQFGQALTITGNETSDVVIEVSLSTNKSFEWIDDGDGLYEPGEGETVVDMGIRGLIPIVQ